MNNSKEKINVLGVEIDNLTSFELNREILNITENDGKELISHVNIHAINLSQKDADYKAFLNDSHINFCDGDGVRLGARILGYTIKEKITYNRWLWELANFSVINNLSWYIVGSGQNVITKASEVLLDRYPTLKLLGYHHGFLNDESLNSKVVSEIKDKKPNILIVGMGMPIQENWLKSNMNEMNFNVALTAGAAFEYASGIAKMTPEFYYNLKLEWLYRFMQEPKRLFKRYFIGNPLFMLRILKKRFFSRT